MKKLTTILLGLALCFGTVATSFAQEKKTEKKAPKKKGKKKGETPKKGA